MTVQVHRASRVVGVMLALLWATGCADVTDPTSGEEPPSPDSAVRSSQPPAPTASAKAKSRPKRTQAQFPNDPESLRDALVESGSECPSISATENWKGEPSYVSASSTWSCDVDEPVEILIMDGSLTGEEWIEQFPHSPVTYAGNWVVIFPSGNQGNRAADRFLDYVQSL